ncbi:alpha/beta hydrolase [Rhodococcus marinonascens]|uniref:alpha/beta hydrolase n=1 Tax=Rhodococcus marinonascens TaxID=38311 RepID=UPI001FE43C20|nr:alpha/beta hydrolase family protein [Rhodococcus marinonascens]
MSLTVTAPASADPGLLRSGAAPSAAYVDHIDQIDDRRWEVYVYSPSMDRVIPLQVIRPADTSVPRPTLYLLNGASGGENEANWLDQTDVVDFFGDKDANVVMPAEGDSSYYTDWVNDDPVLGRNKWTTFLTRELPPVIDSALGTDGINAIAGLSMAATSVLELATQAPDLYRGVGSYSGCAQTSDPVGQAYVRTVVELSGGGDARNMWGPYDGPGWREHDPLVNAEKLRGISLYIANGSGLPGPYEDPARPDTPQGLWWLNQAVIGGAIEVATDVCTHNLADRLQELNIPATFNFRDVGTHSWGYWQDDLHDSWPQLAASLGLSA